MAKNKTYELALKIAGKVDSSLRAACNEADKNLSSLGTAAKTAGKIAVTALAAVATAAAGVALSSLNTYAEFEQAMANTAAIAGATEEDYAALEAAAREMGAATTKTATEAAEALGYMALAGWNTQQSIAGLEPILRLSEATQMDLARASDLVTDSMSALGLGVDEMRDYLDLAVQTNNKANTTAESLMEAFIGCGGAAKTVGVDLTELSTALGILANNGTKGTEAGTAMNAMLVRMSSKDVAINAMKKLGVSVFDAAGNFRGLETVMGDLSKAMANLSTEEKAAYMSKIAGTNYYTEMSYLLDAVAESADGTASAWANLEGQLQGRDGALMNMAGQVTDTLNSAKEIFMSAVQEAQLTIGEQLAPYAQEGLEYLANEVLPAVTEKLGEIIPQLIEAAKWAVEHRDVILAVAGGIVSMVAAYKIAKTVVTAYNAVMGVYKVICAASATGTFTLAGAMAAVSWPVIAVMAAILALVAVVVLLVKNWDKVKATALAVWEKIKSVWNTVATWFKDKVITPVVNFFSAVVGAVTGFFSRLWANIKGVWKAVANWFKNSVITPLVNFFTPIINTISGIFRGAWIIIQAVWKAVSTWFKDRVITPVVTVFSTIVGAVSGFFSTLWGNIVAIWTAVSSWFNDNVITPVISVFSTIVEGVGAFFSGLWENIVAVWEAAGAWFMLYVATPINNAFQAVSDFVKGIFNGLIGFVEGMINKIIGGINGLIGGFSAVVGKAAEFLGIDWGGISELPMVSLPRLAAGGIATAPTLAEIGEGGEPEAVLPLSKLAAMLDGWTKKPKPEGGGRPEPGEPPKPEGALPAGGGETIMFSPVFNFYGPTTPEEAEEAGRISFAEFKRLYKQMKAEERRKSFAPA